jgi:hypothetical protein
VLDALLDALRVARPLDGDPPVSRARADPFDGTLRAREPTARGGGTAGEEVLVRDPDRDARRLLATPVLDIAVERALARRDALLDAADEPQRLPEAVARVGRLLRRERVLERRARVIPARRRERPSTVEEPVGDAGGEHRANISARPGGCQWGQPYHFDSGPPARGGASGT